MVLLETFDSIVIGAGAAGCVVARRLADSGERVLLVEAGAAEVPPSISSVDATAAFDERSWLWPAIVARSRRAARSGRAARSVHAVGSADVDVETPYRQGRGFGGSTAINSMVMTSGDRADYDRWGHEYDCDGWDWASLEPYLRRAVEMLAPSEADLGPMARHLGRIAEAAGHPFDPGAHADAGIEPDRVGFLRASLARDGDRRRSAADAYLIDAGASLTLRSRSAVERLLVEREQAVGVELVDGTRLAAGRVVLSAGSIQSPRLLVRSGVAVDTAGQSIEDHPSFTLTVDLRPEYRQSVEAVCPPVSAVLRWPSADGRGESQAGARAGGGLGRPGRSSSRGTGGSDLMAMVMDHVGTGVAGRRYGAVIVTLTDVVSRGSMVPGDYPMAGDSGPTTFSPGWLTDGHDRARMRAAVRHVGDLLTDPAMAEAARGVYIDDRGTPATTLISMADEELDRWLIDHPGPVSHVASSCPMGSDSRATVGPDGSIQGCRRLFVVDGSILPHLPNGNPQLPIMAVAERLAAVIVS